MKICYKCLALENGDLCKLSNGDSTGSGWGVRTNKTANFAAGVLPPSKQWAELTSAPPVIIRPLLATGQKYAGAELNPKQKATMQTAPLNVPEDAVLKFRYFESAYGVTLKACVDSPDNCPFNTPLDVSPGDREWKDGTVPITKGQHTVRDRAV